MKILLLLVTAVYPLSAFSQLFSVRTEISYYDEKSKEMDDSVGCFYYSMPFSDDGVDTAYSYYCKGKSIRSKHLMNDGLQSGYFEEYYLNGVLKKKGTREKGSILGTSETWYRNGTKKHVIEYLQNEPFKLHDYWDSTGVQLIRNGEGTCRCKFEDLDYDSLVNVGRIRNYRKDSTWTGFIGEHNVFVEDYEDGTLIKGKSFDKNGNTFSYSKINEQAEIPGGLPKLYKFISNHLRYPAAARRKRQAGTVFVSFIVGKDGILYDLHVIKGVSDEIDEEAIRVVRLMPAWNPGLIRGQKVKSRFVLPIKFKLS